MTKEIVMPAFEMAQDTGVLVRWLKAEGELVRKGEPLMEIETDKAVVEVEAPDSGILSHVTARPGDEVPVGRVIALLLSEREQVPASGPRRSSIEVNDEKEGPVRAASTIESAKGERGESGSARSRAAVPRLTPASPKARRLAAERGIALSAISGSGPEGARSAGDVLRISTEPPTSIPSAAEFHVVPIQGMRRTIAQRLQHSYQSAPHISLTISIDLSQARQLLAEGAPLNITAILSKAVVAALMQNPRLNAHLIEQEIREYQAVHLGVAVALEDGLIVPVIRDAQSKSAPAIQSELQDLISRARSGRLQSHEIKGSTFTLSNLGMFGIEQFSAILNPPEVGILSVGAIRDIPVAANGQVVLRPMMQATVNVDHRAVDGAVAARFLSSLKALLEAGNHA